MEEFKPIKDFETFAISNFGNVKDLRTGKLKDRFPDTSGYLIVNCQNPNGWKTLRIHRLVGQHFLEKKDKEEIDHIDRNKLNNNVNNLRWVDDFEQAENKLIIRELPKYIHFYNPNTKKNPYSCYSLQIRCIKLHFKKRFRTDKYTLEEVIDFRNKLLKEHNIQIID
jgi:hypothetical protein